jgi:hypothetical protein
MTADGFYRIGAELQPERRVRCIECGLDRDRSLGRIPQ